MRDEIIDLLRETFYLHSEEIVETTPLESFIADSMDAVEMIAVLGSTYSIRVEPASLDGIQTVADVIAFVERSSPAATGSPLESF